MSDNQLSASFRDPSGFLFHEEDLVKRQVNRVYAPHYDQLMSGGLYDSLTEKGWLIPHTEDSDHARLSSDETTYRILIPEQIPYISYPYEWSFSQLKDAAVLTMEIQLEALQHNMILKDASAYNVQFLRGKPVFIDTLSFETYAEGSPWIAYRQFCQHFLAPLALIVHCDFRLMHLLRAQIDGIALDLASRLLPSKTWFKYSLLAHLHLHAKSQKRYEDSGRQGQSGSGTVKVSRLQLEGLMNSLRSAVQSLAWQHVVTEWGEYYADTNYYDAAMQNKESLVGKLIDQIKTDDMTLAADFGANTGRFSRLAAARGFSVLAHDVDEVAVDKNYQQVQHDGEQSILPLLLDLTNPSPGLGWANEERASFMERERVDLGLALALIHHIAISNNVPLTAIAGFFAKISNFLIIEFVPKTDSQVQRLLATREDVFPQYNQTDFETIFARSFQILATEPIADSERTLYLMQTLPN